MSKIDSFQGEYRFLSNFWPVTITYDGLTYPSVEHAYQAQKAPAEDRPKFIELTAGGAKRLGQKYESPSWTEQKKLTVMAELLKLKFADPELKALLVATYPMPIEEGNTWNDTFWGVCRGVGQNRLGIILENIRFTFIQE